MSNEKITKRLEEMKKYSHEIFEMVYGDKGDGEVAERLSYYLEIVANMITEANLNEDEIDFDDLADSLVSVAMEPNTYRFDDFVDYLNNTISPEYSDDSDMLYGSYQEQVRKDYYKGKL
jgi:hypothetical protein